MTEYAKSSHGGTWGIAAVIPKYLSPRLPLERLDTDYDIYTDSDEKFHVAWDCDLEMVFITLKEKIIDEEI